MPKSQPGAVGNNMPAALSGKMEGNISSNYQGKPRNAMPDYSHNPNNGVPVKDWTQDHMQQARKNKEEKKNNMAS